MTPRRSFLAFSCAIGITTLLVGLARGWGQGESTIPVLILGTYHFGNPGLDMVNAEVDDVLSERRQAEIEAVAEALARFAPTKILLEMEPTVEESFNARYQQFLAGDRALGPNEHDQLGMRLAAMLEHERLVGIDVHQDMNIQSVFEYAALNGQPELADGLAGYVDDIQTMITEVHDSKRSTAQMLRSHNGEDARFGADQGNAFYMVMAEAGDNEHPVGADVVAAWYQRNLRIFANLLRSIEGEDERILVIYGSGHLALLSEFVQQHPSLTLVSALDYLPQK